MRLQTVFAIIRRHYIPKRLISSKSSTMDLSKVLEALNSIAPLNLAAKWDNVGLLVEPSSRCISTILLTIDLTPVVVEEAKKRNTNLIVSYHPPIFEPLKKLTQASWKEQCILKCIENGIAVYAPHTAYDVVAGGLSDWLLEPFGIGTIKPITQTLESNAGGLRVEFSTMDWIYDDSLNEIKGFKLLNYYSRQPANTGPPHHWVFHCTATALTAILSKFKDYQDVQQSLNITALAQVPIVGHGEGRVIELEKPLTLKAVIERAKAHLAIHHVRVAFANDHNLDSPVGSIAVCAGSGGSVLKGVRADVHFTGEMSHHQVLDSTMRGTSVILCEHTNTERGFLKVIQDKLTKTLGLNIFLAESDKDPLTVI